MDVIDVHRPNLDTSMEIETNTLYCFQFFTSLRLNCVILKSSDDNFSDILDQMNPEPITAFHFITKESARYVTICTQNICALILIDDEEKFRQTFQNRFQFKNLVSSLSREDIDELQKYASLESFTLPNKKEQKNIYYDISQVKTIFIPECFMATYEDPVTQWTLSNFLFLTFDSIVCYSIRRFYYPSIKYDDSSFFNALNPDSEFRKFKQADFTTIRHIGGGNTGSISLAIHNETGYLVALKTMKTGNRQTIYEVSFHKLYHHPYILHGYGTYKTGDSTVLVTDYMCNGDLEGYCRDMSLDPTSKTKAVAEILAGIDYLHSNGVMHRDLKPLNILISHDNDFIISDFDTAISYTSNRKKSAAGTFFYMSPESFTDDGSSFQSDLYSFGVIIYELAMGENPFENLSAQDAIERITDGKIQALPTETGTISKLYKRCTEHLKDSRASSFYLLSMLFNETLFFAKSNEEYIYNLYEKIKEIQENLTKKKDQRADIQFVIDGANEGKLYQMFNLAVIYHNAWGGFEQDYKKALYWFEKSAAFDHPASIYDIGNMYYRKRGVPRDFEKAFLNYKKSADLNFIEGYNGLGLMYREGQVPIFDDQRDPVTNFLIHFEEPNYKKAFECFKYAGERGHSYGRCNCGHIYFEGRFSNGKPDYENAAKWYKRAVEVGNKDAEYNLGLIYMNGWTKDGVQLETAFDLFKKAAVQKQPQATYNVATMLRDGVGTEVDFEKAANFFRRSILLKNSQAMADLAELIVDGKVSRSSYCDDPENVREKEKIKINLFVGSDEERKKNFDPNVSLNDAVTLLNNAVSNNNPKAMRILAHLYRDGKGVEKDNDKYKDLLNNAAAAGDQVAKEELESSS